MTIAVLVSITPLWLLAILTQPTVMATIVMMAMMVMTAMMVMMATMAMKAMLNAKSPSGGTHVNFRKIADVFKMSMAMTNTLKFRTLGEPGGETMALSYLRSKMAETASAACTWSWNMLTVAEKMNAEQLEDD